MENRKKSAEAVPEVPRTPAKKQRYIPPIDWDNAPFTPEEAPDGKWGTNSKGDTYLSCSDGSYHYFNADGSYYYSSGKPGNPDANGRSIYISPSKERFYTPSGSPEDNEHGEFFEGIDSRTGQEKIYWQDSTGKIERTLRKHVEWLNIRLSRKYVTLDAETNRLCIVDRDGVPHEDDVGVKVEQEYIKVEDLVMEVVDLTQADE